MRVTIKDLARLAHVSPSTVSRALTDSPLVATATRERIKALAGRLGYSPNGMARGLVTRRSSLLGLMVPDVTNPFFSEWAHAAESEAARRGYAVILCNTMRDSGQEDLKIRSLLELRVAGLFVCSLNLRNPSVLGLATGDVPTVFCDTEAPGLERAYLVHGMDELGGERATRHLASLGRRRIGHLGGTAETLATEHRRRGYRAALDAAGLPWDPDLVVHTAYTEHGGYEAMQRLLEARPDVDGVFAANDLIATGALQALVQAGRRVPADVSLVGYDDIRLASLVHPRLTTIRLSARDMGAAGMRMLLGTLEGSESSPRTLAIEPTLIVRQSCGAEAREEVPRSPGARPV